MKSITFDGRIGANDAEVRQTKGGRPYVRFSVANNSFVSGQEKTEWYEVTSYDPYVIENRVKFLTKGTYVIISGNPNSEVNVDKNGKVWLNQYVTATTIDTPSFKRKEDDNNSPTTEQTVVSTYTGGTPQMTSQVTAAPQTPEVGVIVTGMADMSNDDLPF
jgi:single stranded DNA-binding protein